MAHKKNVKAQSSSQGYMAQRRQILNPNSSFTVREAYKTLRTNICFFLPENRCGKICITSSMAGEGKSITVLNLAISFAETGKRVLLIDADMRRPSQARLLIEKAAPGLSNVLAGMCTEEKAIHKEVYPNLDIIFSGDVPPNPSELLGSNKMESLLEELSKRYDYILVDTPPVNIVSDTCIIARQLDGTLFLVRQNRSDRTIVSKGLAQLQMSKIKLLGFILNGVERKPNRYNEYAKDYYRHVEDLQSEQRDGGRI